ncbi:MAG: asparagine synthase (glutamine-hydrolyzing), partial [Deltaproteobacteria bacterium CG11_big_fil_rev_8_21_14_0_20_45_16]
MCGLIGMIEPSRSREDRSTLGKFLSNHLRHRGPDQEGLWDDAETGLLMAHRRLSILDLSEHGRQPMQSASGRFIICLNGEIYNHQELRLKLQETGANFRGTSDTEVLLAAIEKWGLSESLRKCQGMFALSLWDKESRKLFLVRDRFGEKPLYYGWLKTGTFVFASELRALMAHPDYELEVFGPALNAYLDYNYVREPLSFDKKFKKLIPGEIIELSSPFQSKNLLTDSYWDTSQNLFQTSSAPKSLSFEESIKQLDHLLQEAIKNQMLADVPVGAFLSGGIDSSLVVSKMAQLSPRPIKTFSIGFEEEEYDESNVARQIARLFNTDHHEQILRPQDILERIQDIHTQPDEPFADCSYFPSYLLAKFAKESVSVCLTGDGGDEVFGGYTRYALTKRMYEIKARLPRALQKLSGRLSLLAGKSLPEALLKMLFSNYFRSSNIRQNFDRLAEVLGAEDLWKIYELLMTNRRGHYVLQKDWQEADQTFSESPNSKRLSIIERLILRDTL